MPAVDSARPILLTLARPARRTWLGGREYLSAQGRLAWLGVGLCCAATLAVGAWLRPDPRGYGTHEGLGMPPCSFMLNTELPCPTCGMTTAFSCLLHGHPVDSFMAQPAGLGLCIGTIILMLVAFHAAARGYMVHPNWNRLGPVRVAIGFGLLIAGGWAFKVGYGLWVGSLPVRY